METGNNYWKTGVLVTLIFLVGYLAGIGTLSFLGYVKMGGFPGMRGPVQTMKVLARRLDLNQKQKEEVERIIRRTRRDLSRIREDSRPKVKRCLEKARGEIRILLNEEQREAFDHLVEERLSRLMELRDRMPFRRHRVK